MRAFFTGSPTGPAHGTSFLAPGSLAWRRLARAIHHHRKCARFLLRSAAAYFCRVFYRIFLNHFFFLPFFFIEQETLPGRFATPLGDVASAARSPKSSERCARQARLLRKRLSRAPNLGVRSDRRTLALPHTHSKCKCHRRPASLIAHASYSASRFVSFERERSSDSQCPSGSWRAPRRGSRPARPPDHPCHRWS